MQRLFWRRMLRHILLMGFAFQGAAWADISGGIITDGTMGAIERLDGDYINIPQELGSTVGGNLFHSFVEFNIAADQIVDFTGSGALQNVISRVTGTEVTRIEGALTSSIANAAFYFINPNGIIFGENAQVNIPGDFHVSTADKIDFPAHGGVFYAGSNSVSTLSSEAPAAFGFLDSSSANNGLIQVNGARIGAGAGQTLDMVAGDIMIENNAIITTPTGEMRLVALQGAGSVSLDKSANGALPLPDVTPTPTNSGRISLNNSAIDTSGGSASRIGLWGGAVSLTNSSGVGAFNNETTDVTSENGIDIHSSSLTVDHSLISSETRGVGKAGNIAIKTGALDIRNSGVISSSTFAGGNAGNVNVVADVAIIDNQGTSKVNGIVSRAEKGSSGQAGNVTVKAGTLNILNGGNISSSTFAQGGAGRISVTADTLSIDDTVNSRVATGIISRANEDSRGQTGNIIITVNDSLYLAGSGLISIENRATVSAADAALINPGFINITAANIAMTDSRIISRSIGNIAAGEIAVNFSRQLNMVSADINTTANTGDGGSVTVNGGESIYLQNAGFTTTVRGVEGNGGDIFTTADILVMDTGLIQANAVSGSGGDILLNLKALIPSGNSLLLGGSPVIWQPSEFGFNLIQAASETGVSGTVNVTAPQLNLSGIIANLGGAQFDTDMISQDYCNLGIGSSLTRTGSGGLKPKSATQLLF
ncbi:MAG: filamentous hemagglutinin N-terminal domain-containing protein [Methylobacter sp.]|nr:filamentous hemagglutinin N-terminal domain-containing protein [Methylobacter sp.]MDP3055842.1 filamentous hemagglutinin N-terminal domain-containing protein [Methylobacter sp.]MDP3361669.1 filamentous hemagglutinin N-terminal domain-containing protein [Methylobacter sp.]